MFSVNKISAKITLALAGAIYFSIFSHLELNLFLKSYLVIVPIQIAALIFGLYTISADNRSEFKEH